MCVSSMGVAVEYCRVLRKQSSREFAIGYERNRKLKILFDMTRSDKELGRFLSFRAEAIAAGFSTNLTIFMRKIRICFSCETAYNRTPVFWFYTIYRLYMNCVDYYSRMQIWSG